MPHLNWHFYPDEPNAHAEVCTESMASQQDYFMFMLNYSTLFIYACKHFINANRNSINTKTHFVKTCTHSINVSPHFINVSSHRVNVG